MWPVYRLIKMKAFKKQNKVSLNLNKLEKKFLRNILIEQRI